MKIKRTEGRGDVNQGFHSSPDDKDLVYSYATSEGDATYQEIGGIGSAHSNYRNVIS